MWAPACVGVHTGLEGLSIHRDFDFCGFCLPIRHWKGINWISHFSYNIPLRVSIRQCECWGLRQNSAISLLEAKAMRLVILSLEIHSTVTTFPYGMSEAPTHTHGMSEACILHGGSAALSTADFCASGVSEQQLKTEG